MAEAPVEGLYEPVDEVEFIADRLEVTGERFGPAGLSSVELPDGSTWSVDHVDPGRLVALDVAATDPAGSPLLVAAFGGDVAMLLVDRAGSIDRPDAAAPAARAAGPGRRRGRSPAVDTRPEADEAGRLVVLGDLAQDTSLDPLVRIVAVVELVALAARTPAGDLFDPLLAPLVDLAESLAASADPTPLGFVDGRGKRLAVLGDAFTARFGDRAPGVVQLLERRQRDEWYVASDELPPMRADQEWEPAPLRAAPEVAAMRMAEPPEALIVERVNPSLLEVSTTRSRDERWVRVLRRDGLVLLAQAPLRLDGLVDRAELLVPPDTPDDELAVQIVDVDQLTAASRRPAEVIRDAVRAGRAAASAERRGDFRLALRRWFECAELWAEIGDVDRSELAAERTSTAGGRFRGEPLLVDGLDPYGGATA